MLDVLKKHLTKILNVILLMLFAASIAFWWIKSDRVDLESARQTLSVVVQIEIAIFALTIAGLAFVSNVLSNQSARLDRLRERWLDILIQTDESVLKEIEEIYLQRFQDDKSLPANYKYPAISHLKDREVIQYLPALLSYRTAAKNKNLTELNSYALDLDADSMLLFRISCAVLFSQALEARRNTDLISQLIRRLKDLNRAENIVVLINNLYDSRLAASRGLPVFVFFTLAAIVLALATLSVLSGTNFNRVLYGLSTFPIILIVMFAGYYISQILKRYF